MKILPMKRLLLEETMVQEKKDHPEERSLIFGRGKGENVFSVCRLSLHDASNG